MVESEPHIVLLGGDGGRSGVPRHITDLTRALIPKSRITVLSEANRGGYDSLRTLGATHVTLPGLASRMGPRSAAAGKAALGAWLAAHPADLVWAHARMPVLYLRALERSGGWRPTGARALTYHGLPFGPGHRWGTGAVSRLVERRLLCDVPRLNLVFLTDEQRDRLKAAIGAPSAGHDCHVLSNASHLGAVPARSGAGQGRHLVMTGRTGWQKNYAAALRLMRHLPRDITLSLCGAGTQSPNFAAKARQLAGHGADRVKLLGPVKDIASLLTTADGYLLTSRYEGQPIGALEAMEAGLPLMIAPFQGARELIADNPFGCLLTGAPADQAAAIDRLLRDYLTEPEIARTQIRRFWSARFSPARFAEAANKLVFDCFLD
ncbi:glycosyltransferase family 4 protein [Parasedimentitalea maritima]|uniref:Glycosyltransferase family 4 protein n=1 Tax=Parasedimentitalea maritima TaxID=2578117 RepID=A0ABY2UUC0_9RHOB|nr:glycosyltransferase family 4 protein [Zongyanglinia marina]TLP60287.1 glycosyltransferase family 4 protein [Zongyanglinia marina]